MKWVPREDGGSGRGRGVCLLLPPHLPPWAAPRPCLEATDSTAPGLHVLGVGLGVGTGSMGCFRGPGFGAGVSVGYESEATGCGEGS